MPFCLFAFISLLVSSVSHAQPQTLANVKSVACTGNVASAHFDRSRSSGLAELSIDGLGPIKAVESEGITISEGWPLENDWGFSAKVSGARPGRIGVVFDADQSFDLAPHEAAFLVFIEASGRTHRELAECSLTFF